MCVCVSERERVRETAVRKNINKERQIEREIKGRKLKTRRKEK